MENFLSLVGELTTRLGAAASVEDAFAIKAKLDAEWEDMKKDFVRAKVRAGEVAAAQAQIAAAQKIIDGGA